jgi:hypothetical protein
MPSLDDHFRSLTGVRPPADWPELNEREPRSHAPPAGIGRRSGVATLAIAIAAGGLVFAVRAFLAPWRRRRRGGTASSPSLGADPTRACT